ncbi:MAG: LysM peptidoglycan-binding domain-containing protein [Candidatus Sericytochromatia bacterium]
MSSINLPPSSIPAQPVNGRTSKAADTAQKEINKNVAEAVAKVSAAVAGAGAASVAGAAASAGAKAAAAAKGEPQMIGAALGALAGAMLGGIVGSGLTLPDNRVYQIKEGDTLSKIAKDSLGPKASEADIQKFVEKVATLNSDLIKNPDSIQTGDKIAVPLNKAGSAKQSQSFVDD